MNSATYGCEVAELADGAWRPPPTVTRVVLKLQPGSDCDCGLRLSDLGRPVGDIVPNLVGYDRIVADTHAVLDTLIPKEVEVQTRTGAWYTMRILPYRTLDNVIEGAVITFVDINEIKKARDERRESEMKFRGLFENTVSAIALYDIVVDERGEAVDCIFLEANSAFERQTGLHVADILGKRITEVWPGIEKTHLITTYGKVATNGVSVSFELFFEPTQRYYYITAYQVGRNRFASVFADQSNRRPQDRTEPA